MRRTSPLYALAAGTLLPFALAACGSDEPPVAHSFPPLHYEYLPKLRLNVGQIEVTDRTLPVGPQDVAASSPAVPSQVLAQMARDRLFAAGTAGSAGFTVDQASIVREPNGALDGQLAVHLDLNAPGGARAGFAEARVARQYVPGSDSEDGSANLYTLTRQMMDAMNVELEFQVRQSLKPWLVMGSGVPAPVAAQPLNVPGEPPPVTAPVLPPATPETPARAPQDTPQFAPNDSFQDPAAPLPEPQPSEQPQQMSPPPGFLQPPPGAAQALPPASGY